MRANLYLLGNITEHYKATRGSIEFFLACGGMSARMCNDTRAAANAAQVEGYHAHFLNVSRGGNAQGYVVDVGRERPQV